MPKPMAREALSEYMGRKSSWSLEESHLTPTAVLSFLRLLVLTGPLYLYTILGPARDFPPVVPYSYLLVVAVLCAWWLWKAAHGQMLARSPLALPMIGIVAASTISTIFSVDRRLSIDALLATVAFVLFFFFFCDLLLGGWSSATFVNAFLAFVSLLICQSFWDIGTWYWTWELLRVAEYSPFLIPYRLFGIANHPNLLASLVAMALPFAIMRLAFARTLPMRSLWAVWLLAAEVILLYTRSRGGTLASVVVVSLVVSWLLVQRSPSRVIGNPKRALLKHWLWESRHICATTFLYLASYAVLFLLSEATSQSDYSTNGGSIAAGASRFTFWRVAWTNFLTHPVTGSGPLTYGRIYVDSVDTIRNWIAPHAHNLVLNTIAEQGIIGGLGLGWVVVVGFVTLGRTGTWRPLALTSHEHDRHVLLVSVAAALAGFLVHSQFDVLTWRPANSIVVVALSALAMHASGRLHQTNQRISGWMALPCIIAALLGVVIFRYGDGQVAMLQAVEAAGAQRWGEAASKLDQAIDLDPDFGFYYGQRGYAYGVLALPLSGSGDPAAAVKAISSYRVALQREPQYVPHLLNIAALLDVHGFPVAAEQELAAAVVKGEDWALPALLLGERYERRGDFAEARRLFELALNREAHAVNMAACRRSPTCSAVAEAFVSRRQRYGSEPIAQVHEHVRVLLAQGQAEEALAWLAQVPVSNSDPRPWLDRSASHLALGQIAPARLALRIADVLNVNLPPTAAEAALVRSDLAVANGNREAAIEALEMVARVPAGDILYSYDVFWRVGLPGTLLPQLELLQRTATDVEVYQKLSALYRQQNRHAEAMLAEQQIQLLRNLFEPSGNK